VPRASPAARPGSQRARCSSLPASAMSAGAGDGRQERRGRQRGAELLLDDGQLDDAEAQPAVLLGDSSAGQPSSQMSAQPSSVKPALGLVGQAADLLGLVARGEEVARGALDRALVVGEVEVHQRIRGSRARARRRCS
jgi:hypothetical protein